MVSDLHLVRAPRTGQVRDMVESSIPDLFFVSGMSVTLEEVTLVRDIFAINGKFSSQPLVYLLTTPVVFLPQIMFHKIYWIFFAFTESD